MKVSERVELYHLQKYASMPRKVKPIGEIAKICESCSGRCKAAKGLVYCPTKERSNANAKR